MISVKCQAKVFECIGRIFLSAKLGKPLDVPKVFVEGGGGDILQHTVLSSLTDKLF
jgi:hypothetical protein